MGILIWDPKEIDQLIDPGKNRCLFGERLLMGAAARPPIKLLAARGFARCRTRGGSPLKMSLSAFSRDMFYFRRSCKSYMQLNIDFLFSFC